MASEKLIFQNIYFRLFTLLRLHQNKKYDEIQNVKLMYRNNDYKIQSLQTYSIQMEF